VVLYSSEHDTQYQINFEHVAILVKMQSSNYWYCILDIN